MLCLYLNIMYIKVRRRSFDVMLSLVELLYNGSILIIKIFILYLLANFVDIIGTCVQDVYIYILIFLVFVL